MLSPPFFFKFHHPHFHNHIEDFSSHLLVEATGDSEVVDASTDIEGSSTALNSIEFNDAESCTGDAPALYDEYPDKIENENENENEDREEGEIFENDDVVESKANNGFTTKSSASIDSTKEFKMLSEVEKNKLFWETCLAS